MPKPTDADKEFFRSLVPDDPRVETKPKFGNLGAFVNSNMFMGLFGGDVGIKLPDADREALLREKGAGPFGPAERPMGGYVTLPASCRAVPMRAEPWITKALDHVGSLPAKVKKSKTPRYTPASGRLAAGYPVREASPPGAMQLGTPCA